MPTLLSDSNHPSHGADKEVTVRVVADGGRRRRPLLGSIVSLLVVGALAVGVLAIAGRPHRAHRHRQPLRHVDRRPFVPRLAQAAQQPVVVLGCAGPLPADDRRRGRRVDPAVVHRRRAHHLRRERDGRRHRRLLGALDRCGAAARRRRGDGHVAGTATRHRSDRSQDEPRRRSRARPARTASVASSATTRPASSASTCSRRTSSERPRSTAISSSARSTTRRRCCRGFLGRLGYTDVNVVYTSPTAVARSAG